MGNGGFMKPLLKETKLNSIRSLMETMNFSAQQAMDALKIPANKQEEYCKLI